jgi:hypothetical protein
VRRSRVISIEFKFAGRTFVSTDLLFVDDCFLFCRATEREVNVLKNIVSIYKDVLSQQINFQKFKVLFSKNGWPSIHDRKEEKRYFKYIMDRVWKKINSWGGRLLSKVGKKMMINSCFNQLLSIL